MSASNLVTVTPRADEALTAFDYAAHDNPSSVRLYLQGFG